MNKNPPPSHGDEKPAPVLTEAPEKRPHRLGVWLMRPASNWDWTVYESRPDVPEGWECVAVAPAAEPASPATQADVDAFTASLRRRSNPWAYGCADLIDKLWLATQAPKASPAVSGAEPYGQVTTHSQTGQQFFYRWPEPPYLDNASECVTVYAERPSGAELPVLTDAAMLKVAHTSVKTSKKRGSMRRGPANGLGGSYPTSQRPSAPFKAKSKPKVK